MGEIQKSRLGGIEVLKPRWGEIFSSGLIPPIPPPPPHQENPRGDELHLEVALDPVVGIFVAVGVHLTVLKPFPVNSA